jgi:hypothetical protein
MITADTTSILDVHVAEERQQYEFQLTDWYGAIPIECLTTAQLRLLREIGNLVSLPHGWDSYGSLPPTTEAVASAISQILRNHSTSLPSAQVFPVSGGGIQFVWQKSGRTLDLEFLPNGSIEYLTSESGNQRLEGELANSNHPMMQALMAWVAGV